MTNGVLFSNIDFYWTNNKIVTIRYSDEFRYNLRVYTRTSRMSSIIIPEKSSGKTEKKIVKRRLHTKSKLKKKKTQIEVLQLIGFHIHNHQIIVIAILYCHQI